jgi:hypothetical protein
LLRVSGVSTVAKSDFPCRSNDDRALLNPVSLLLRASSASLLSEIQCTNATLAILPFSLSWPYPPTARLLVTCSRNCDCFVASGTYPNASFNSGSFCQSYECNGYFHAYISIESCVDDKFIAEPTSPVVLSALEAQVDRALDAMEGSSS